MVTRAAAALLAFCACTTEDPGPVFPGGGNPSALGDGGADAALSSCEQPIALEAAGTYVATASAADAGVGGCDAEARGGIFSLELAEASWVYLDSLDSEVDVALSVRAGDCEGVVLACSEFACGRAQGQLLLSLAAGRYLVVGSPAGGQGGDVALRFQVSACRATPLVPGPNLGVVGTCPGGGSGSCGGGGTVWCASGVEESVWILAGCGQEVQIDTCAGTLFDSVLYMRAGDCAGEEVACVNADGCGDGDDDEVLSGVLGPGMYFLFVDSEDWWDQGFNLRLQ